MAAWGGGDQPRWRRDALAPRGNQAESCLEVSHVRSREEIEQKIVEIVAEQMGVDKAEINSKTSFVNDLNADSLDTVELVMEFEDEFELTIPDDEAEKIQTVGQAVDYVFMAQGTKAPEKEAGAS